MAAALQFPFTRAQWKELERQAMIYKYMMASIPVPTNLLFPLPSNFPAEITTTTTRGVDLYGWRYSSSAVKSSNSKDAEPGRCKRTDGKKWRCSRDVAPNQKYCERHMHRGRPRSRKHVEVQPLLSQNNITTNKKTRLNHSNLNNIPSSQHIQPTAHSDGTSHVLPKINTTDLSINTSAKREVNLGMEDKIMGIEVVGQQWVNIMNPKIENHISLFQQQYDGEVMNLFSYTDSTAVTEVNIPNQESQLFLNSSPRTRSNLSPSSLTLSMAMAAGNVIDEEMEKIQERGCEYKNKATNIFSSHSWIPFPSGGGPLAEVLHNGGATNPASTLYPKGRRFE